MKELFYIEFIYALKEGKKLRRLDWVSNVYIQAIYHSSSSYTTPYIKQTFVFKSGAEEYSAYLLAGDDIFTARWVEYIEGEK